MESKKQVAGFTTKNKLRLCGVTMRSLTVTYI